MKVRPLQGVLAEVVERAYCAGCGVCAAVCPSERLSMQFNSFGEYVPVAGTENSCGSHCRACLSVCPFSASLPKEDEIGRERFAGTAGIRHDPCVGYYLDSFAGSSHIHDHWVNGASGGLTTWMLETLFQMDEIDGAVCVTPTPGEPTLFRAAVCRGPEEVRRCSKSCYYPIEFSRVLREVLTVDGRYAVVALPCVAKALRMAAGQNGTLSHRVRYILGLICGQTRSVFFSEYLCALAGGDPAQTKAIQFRIKDSHRPASDHGIRIEWGKGEQASETRLLSWSEGPGRVWSQGYFTLNACRYCDDVFAELADASFMDAWLPQYVSDPRGTSLVVVRHPTLRSVLEAGVRTGVIGLHPVSVEAVAASQRRAIRVKRSDLAVRLYLAQWAHRWTPPKRVTTGRRPPIHEMLRVWLDVQSGQASRVAFAEQKRVGWSAEGFTRRMRVWRVLGLILQRAHAWVSGIRMLGKHVPDVARRALFGGKAT